MKLHVNLTVIGLAIIMICYADKTTDEILNALEGYDSRIRAVGPTGPDSPVDVVVTMYILDVAKVDDMNKEFTAQMFLRQKWNDSRLKYSDKSSSVRYLHHEDLSRIWKPDLFFVDESHAKLHTVVFANSFLRWFPNGTMFLSIRFTVTSRCHMDLRYYPHDEQVCSLRLESYTYTADDVKLRWEVEDPVGITPTIIEPNFRATSIKHFTEDITFKTANYTRLQLDITFGRKTGFYLTKIYIPYIALTIVAWLSLWINPKLVQFRLSLLFAVLFIMFILATDIGDYIPRVSYTKAIDIWTAFCISFVFCIFLEYVLLVQSDKEKEEDESNISVTADVESLKTEEKEEKISSNLFPFRRKNVGQNMGNVNKHLFTRADQISRIMFPVLFAIFNVLYWSVYAS